MKISPINNIQQPQFQGELRAKGEWPYNLKTIFLECNAMQNVAKKSEHDIIGSIKVKKSRFGLEPYAKNQKIYKIMLEEDKQPKTLLEKLINFIKPTKSLNRHYHSDNGLVRILYEVTEGYIEKRLK